MAVYRQLVAIGRSAVFPPQDWKGMRTPLNAPMFGAFVRFLERVPGCKRSYEWTKGNTVKDFMRQVPLPTL